MKGVAFPKPVPSSLHSKFTMKTIILVFQITMEIHMCDKEVVFHI